MAIAIAQSQAITTTGDQTINITTGGPLCIVVIHYINDADGAHTGRDSGSTFGGNSMTDLFGSQLRNSPHTIDGWYQNNVTYSGNTVYHYGNHGGFGTIAGMIYVLTGVDTTTPLDATSVTANTTGANPSLSITTVTANALLLDGLGCGNSATAGASQTVDVNGTGSFAYMAHRDAGATGSKTDNWTMSSAAYVYGLAAIRPSSGAAAVTSHRMFAMFR